MIVGRAGEAKVGGGTARIRTRGAVLEVARPDVLPSWLHHYTTTNGRPHHRRPTSLVTFTTGHGACIPLRPLSLPIHRAGTSTTITAMDGLKVCTGERFLCDIPVITRVSIAGLGTMRTRGRCAGLCQLPSAPFAITTVATASLLLRHPNHH